METLKELVDAIDSAKSSMIGSMQYNGAVQYDLSDPFEVMAAKLLMRNHPLISYHYEDRDDMRGRILWNGPIRKNETDQEYEIILEPYLAQRR